MFLTSSHVSEEALPAGSGKSNQVLINIKRGTSLSSMENFTAVRVKSENATANTIRKELKSDMLKADRFLTIEGFPVRPEDESITFLKDLITVGKVANDDAESKKEDDVQDDEPLPPAAAGPKIIQIIAKDQKKKEPVQLGEWPKEPGFWQSDVMNDQTLPPSGNNKVVAPDDGTGTTINLEQFLDVNNFGIAQWTELIKNNNLLNGVRMDNPYGPRPSAYPLVKAPPKLEDFYTYRNPNAYIDSQTTYSERHSKYINQGWGKASLSVGTPFVSAAAEVEHHYMGASNTLNKQIFSSASYKYAFVTVAFDPKTLEPSDKFTKAVETAMKETSDDSKKKALEVVFQRYGHIYQTEVTLGAQLVTTDSTITSVKASETKFETSLKAKMAGAISAYSADAAVAGGVESDSKTGSKEQQEHLTITAKGGNPLLSTNIPKWIPSVGDYRTWRIIDIQSAVPITEFIVDQALRKKVEKLSNADPVANTRPLRGRWVEPGAFKSNAQGDGTDWFRTYRPDVGDDSSGWYWLGPSLDSRWALIVKENIPNSGALCPIRSSLLIHNNAASKAKDDESFWTLLPSHPDYVALGNFFQSGVSFDGSWAAPDLSSAGLKSLRAVKRDLCVKATLSAKEVWSNRGEGTKDWATVYRVAKLPESEEVVDVYSFRTFQSSPNDRGKNLRSEEWMLKASSIYIEPWQ